MKIGFIGTGNMAGAIIEGIVAKEFVQGNDIYLYDVLVEKLNAFSEKLGTHTCLSAKEVVDRVDVLVLSVKPHIIEEVLQQTKEKILEKKILLVSIAGGTPLSKLESFIGKSELSIIRVMPNVNAMIGEGAAAVCGNDHATSEQINYVIKMFESVGKAWKVDEHDFSTYTALASSSPAFAYMFMDSLARAGVKHGIPKDRALEYVAQAVLGSAKMILETKENPWTLIDRVSSPGGTTVAGLLAMEEDAFIATVVKGVDATIDKDKEMNVQ